MGTVVTVASHCPNQRERDANIVRFVTLRRSIRELVGGNENEAEHLNAVDRLRDRILGLTGIGESDDLDWSAVPQSELIKLGDSVVRVMTLDPRHPPQEETSPTAKYGGAAWRSRFLRAPKIALELAARRDFRAWGFASVKLGLKTGADDFFFLERGSASKHFKSCSVTGCHGCHGKRSLARLDLVTRRAAGGA